MRIALPDEPDNPDDLVTPPLSSVTTSPTHPAIKSPTAAIFDEPGEGGYAFVRRIGDALPDLTGSLKDAQGLLDVTGANVLFQARLIGATDWTACEVNMNSSAFTLDWSDLTLAGEYTGAFVVTYADTANVSVPNDVNIRFRLLESL